MVDEDTLRRIIREELAARPSEPEQAVDAAAMAKILGVSKETVVRYARTGDIPGQQIGSKWVFYPSAVRAYLTRPRDPWQQPKRSLARRRSTVK